MSSSVLVKRGRYEVPTSQTKKTVLCTVCNLAAREDYIKHRHLRSLIIWSNEDSNKPARKGTREYDGANAEQRSHTEYWSQHITFINSQNQDYQGENGSGWKTFKSYQSR